MREQGAVINLTKTWNRMFHQNHTIIHCLHDTNCENQVSYTFRAHISPNHQTATSMFHSGYQVFVLIFFIWVTQKILIAFRAKKVYCFHLSQKIYLSVASDHTNTSKRITGFIKWPLVKDVLAVLCLACRRGSSGDWDQTCCAHVK